MRVSREQTLIYGAKCASHRIGEMLRFRVDLNFRGHDYNFDGDNIFTALDSACFYGNENIALLLLDKGANINAKSDDGLTALHLACSKAYNTVATLLLDRGADIHAKDIYGRTALHLACSNRSISAANNRNCASLLLDRGADIHAKDIDGRTAIYFASMYNYFSVVDLLLNRGADIESRDNASYDAFAIETVATLLLARPCISYNQNGGMSILQLACLMGHQTLTNILIERGADINVKDIVLGRTAFHWASIYCHGRITELLHRMGANIKSKDNDGRTALHLACKHSHFIKIKELLGFIDINRKGGIEINAKDNEGFTALHLACSYGRVDLVSLFLGDDKFEEPSYDIWWYH